MEAFAAAPAQHAESFARRGTHRYSALERVIYGTAFDKAVTAEVEALGAMRVLIVTTHHMPGSPVHRRLLAALGERCCGTFGDAQRHVPVASVLQGAEVARQAGADLIISVGGGSAVDTGKAIALALRYGLKDATSFGRFGSLAEFDPSRREAVDAQFVRSIALPTTLSAAELTWYAGVTDANTRMKQVVGHPALVPVSVIYDPELTLGVPLNVFLASGIKAVDHAAERLASLQAQPFSDAVSQQALTMLAQALPRVLAAPHDLDARLDCQLAAWLSISGGASGVGVGASHAIGHMLGAHTAMEHGLTSCVMLPAVMRWNQQANGARQKLVSRALGREDLDAGDAIEVLIRSLNLPWRLRDVGVATSELTSIAEKTMHDLSIHKNPRAISGAGDVLEILRLAY
ncbi:iron-containing alcohol dehydrogenase [Diaphorobacter sp. HDW4A]|uniref:iron-containing alcohol dehydrogenase n=1 Tax=Diaphorobacter sp. HDW4A TaxID=2714924 RepID=UPI001407D6DA|nr:iron-containing alcohol dehydrogenase [Diaphorobacter sp. HDW4A]QIL80170.1 iron-containing alcohol dehydrogenase [Diaphorobacter sp. HDW4A]